MNAVSIPQTMRRLVITAPGEIEWAEASVPTPKPEEVLVKVLGVSSCPHWDLHILGGEPMFPGQDLHYPYLPGQPGHEAVGEVAAVGSAVASLRVGQRVVAWRDTGEARPGFYAQFNTFRAVDLLPVSAERPHGQWASVELGMCVEVSFQRLAELGGVRGRRVAIAGLGPAGLVAVQLARHHGAAAVIGMDPVTERRELALRLGATHVETGEAASWPADRNDERAADVAIDCTGLAPVVEFLLRRTRQAVALFGVVRDPIRYDGALMWGPGVTLVGYGDHNRTAAETAIAAVEAGTLDLSALITTTLPLRDYVRGVGLLRRKEAIKVLFDPWA
ncbi:zinc-dependent alcohol dehydrogenase [Actomonas aquatica]|uniref:Zinc-binding dehydrogenase n=1 Tax=Actomonas aquatica TaxID=2866162 RepID=A0ABZ1C4G3_9BACT|nr:zinc-binding dehydrogenase [Opitutus sp. WL0086]WRQ86376.1 zinc-binding dehydrogenase [Opitutus sp. WL0086]